MFYEFQVVLIYIRLLFILCYYVISYFTWFLNYQFIQTGWYIRAFTQILCDQQILLPRIILVFFSLTYVSYFFHIHVLISSLLDIQVASVDCPVSFSLKCSFQHLSLELLPFAYSGIISSGFSFSLLQPRNDLEVKVRTLIRLASLPLYKGLLPFSLQL